MDQSKVYYSVDERGKKEKKKKKHIFTPQLTNLNKYLKQDYRHS